MDDRAKLVTYLSTADFSFPGRGETEVHGRQVRSRGPRSTGKIITSVAHPPKHYLLILLIASV